MTYMAGLSTFPTVSFPVSSYALPGLNGTMEARPFAPTENPFQPLPFARDAETSEPQPGPQANTSVLAAAWKKVVFLAPVLGFIGSSALIAKSLPKGMRDGIVKTAFKAIGRDSMRMGRSDERLRAFGQKTLGFAVLLKSLGGISAGIVSGQPSMIWGNLIQIIPSGILAFKRSNALQNFATSMEMLLGGLFTLGFANELKNKDARTAPGEIRRYDMSRLKSLFQPGQNLTFKNRLEGLLNEMKRMARFTAQDHIQLVRDLSQKSEQLLDGKRGNPPERSNNSFQGRLLDWAGQPSAAKSQVAVLFFYLGTLPILLLTRRNPKIGEKKSIVALKATGLAIANLAPFAIALNRDDLHGKGPLIGAPMTVIGMANSKSPFFVGLGHLGEAFNDLFFSDVAVNGVKTGTEIPRS